MSDRQKSTNSVLMIFSLVVVMFFMFMGFSFYVLKSSSDKVGLGSNNKSASLFEQFAGEKDQSGPIGVIELDGVIMNSKKMIELLHEAEENKEIQAIILKINSPGGAVGPTQEIYEEIVRIDKNKPIYASFESIAASGGYYLGAACRNIYSNAGTITGSIGVIMQTADLSELYKWAMYKPEVIKAGKFKDAGGPHRPLKEEEVMMMTQMLNVVHRQFKEDIIKRRGDKLKGDIEVLAQGQIFSGEEALSVGLVDSIGGLWKAAREIHQELKIKEDFSIQYIQKKKKFSLNYLMNDLEESSKSFINKALFSKQPMFL